MAIYHCSIGNVSRAKGSASTASAAYITGMEIYDERTGQTFDYARKERVIAGGIICPEGMPEEWRSPAALFNSIEQYERSSSARTAKKIEIALPRELTLEQQKEAVRGFIRRELQSRGYAALWCIHDDGGGNPHAHILTPNRQISPDGSGWQTVKSRKEYKLDKDGQRIPVIDPATGEQKVDSRNRKQWQRVTVQAQPLDRKETLQQIRASWAQVCNERLDADHQIDHRSLKDQGIDREPTIHEGYAARRIEAVGGVSDRCQANREIRERRSLLQQLTEKLQQILQSLSKLMRGYREPQEPDKLPSLDEMLKRGQDRSRGSRKPSRSPEKDWELER